MNTDGFNNNLNQENSNTGDSLNNLYGNGDSLNTNTPTPPDISNSVNTYTDTSTSINNDLNNSTIIDNNNSHPDVIVNPLTNDSLPKQEVKEKKPVNKKLIIIIGICIVIILIILVIFSLFSSKKSNSSNSNKNNDESGFNGFVENKDVFFLDNGEALDKVRYALFDRDGNKITDFDYNYGSPFINGLATVSKNNKQAVIDTKGKERLPFGEYTNISLSSGVITAQKTDGLTYYLLDSDCKTKYTFKNFDTSSVYGSFSFDSPYFNFQIDDNKILIFDNKGNRLNEYEMTDEDKASYNKFETLVNSLSQNELYSSIYYNNSLTIYDNKTMKVLYDFKNPVFNAVYSVFNDDEIVLYDKDKGSKNGLGIIYKGEIKPITCDNYKIDDDAKVFLCEKNNKEYMVNSDGSMTLETKKTTKFIDYKNYAVNETKDGKNIVKFYNNSKLVNTIENAQVKYDGNESYLITFTEEGNDSDNKYSIVDKSGKIIFKKKYKDLKGLDINNRTIYVSDDEKKYLMDKKEVTLSKGYDTISQFLYKTNPEHKYYYHISTNKLYGVMYYNGKELIPPTCSLLYLLEQNGEDITVSCKTQDGKYLLYSSKDGILLTTDDELNHSDYDADYVYTETFDEKRGKEIKTFYTFKGKEFYKQ